MRTTIAAPVSGSMPSSCSLTGLCEDLLGPLGGQLVGGDAGRQRLARFAPLEVRAVTADANDDVGAREHDGVHLAGVDVAEVLLDERLQPVVAVRAEVEAAQPAGPRPRRRAAISSRSSSMRAVNS